MIPRKLYIILLVLIGVIIINSIIHFTSPAYRYYSDNFKRVDRQFVQFKEDVSLKLIPTFVSSISNVLDHCSNTVKFVSSTNSLIQSQAMNDNNNLLTIPQHIQAQYFVCSGNSYIVYDNHFFSVGDIFLGQRILEIFPNTLITDHQIITFGRVLNERPATR